MCSGSIWVFDGAITDLMGYRVTGGVKGHTIVVCQGRREDRGASMVRGQESTLTLCCR